MAQGSRQEEDIYNVVSCHPLTDETTNTKRQRLITSTETLTSMSLQEPPLPTLPFDLLSEILCRLPVRLLVQLRCLCKSFNSLISDPKFVKKHLRLSTKQHHLVLSSREFLFYDSPIPSVLSTFTITQTELDYPLTRKIDGFDKPYSLSTCDGILCFAIDSGSLILWNPSIRKFRLLPTPSENPRKMMHSIYSFGHDPFIDGYKIICISFFLCRETKVRVNTMVNTMGTDYWRRIQDFPCSRPTSGGPGVFVSGTVNWLRLRDSRVIVSLDLKKESYQNLSLPELEKGIWNSHLGRVRDCLCIFASYKRILDVWIMKEYGNKESWSKLYHVPYMVDPAGWCAYPTVPYISQDDQLLMSYYVRGILKLVVYECKDGTSNNAEILNTVSWTNQHVYIESLISPC